MDAQSSGFGQYDFHPLVVQVMVNGTRRVAAASDAGHQVIGVIPPFLFQQLFPDFLTDDRLQPGHHVGIGMRSDGRADDVEGVRRVTAPVSDGLVGGIFQCHVSGGDGAYGSSQHLHPLYVDVLALHVGLSHIDHAFHSHQGTDGGGGYAVLAGSGFGDDSFLSHPPCQENLADGVVDFVGSGMVEVFPLQVDLASVFFGKPAGQVQGRRASYVIFEQLVKLFLETGIFQHVQVSVLQFTDAFVKDFGDISSAEFSVIAFLVYLIGTHNFILG